MNYQLTSDNMQVTPSMEVLAKDKFVRIEHRLRELPDGSKSVRIVMNTAPENMFVVKAKLNANGVEFFSNETDFSLEGALIKTVEELTNMLEKKHDVKHQKDKAAALDILEQAEEALLA